MSEAVICIADSDIQAELIVKELQLYGLMDDEISVLIPDKGLQQDFAHENSTKAPEGATIGVGTGGVIGGAVGLFGGIGAIAIPGAGPFIAAGPIMAALSGAAIGGAVGGISGGLIGLGLPEYEAKLYEGKVRGGNILVAAHSEEKELMKQAENVFKRNKARDIHPVGEASAKR